MYPMFVGGSDWTIHRRQSGFGGYFGDGRYSGAFVFVLEDGLIPVSMKLGVVPQFFALLSSLGGFVSMSFLIFGFIFVKRYPYSDISRTYEQRTLLGYPRDGNPVCFQPGVETAHRTSAPTVASRNNAVSGVSTVGLMQQHRHQGPEAAMHGTRMPPLPPGIALPAGYRPTE